MDQTSANGLVWQDSVRFRNERLRESSHARVTSIKFHNKHRLTEWQGKAMQWSDLGPIKIFENISIWNSSLNGVASAFQVSTKRYIVHAMQCTMIYVLKRYILQWFMMWRDIYFTVSVTVNPFLLSRLLSPTFHLPKSKVRFPSKNTKYIKKKCHHLHQP